MTRKIRNASIDELDSGQGHLFCRYRGVGRYYLIGGDEYRDGTLLKFEEFSIEEMEVRIEKLMREIKKSGKHYTEDYNLDSRVMKMMIDDLIPFLKYHE